VVEEDVRRLRWSATRVVIYAALLLGLTSFALVDIVSPAKWLDWLIELSATLVAALLTVAGGIWLFRYQGLEAEEKLREKLLIRLAVESQTNLERLESRPTPFIDARTGTAVGEAVAVELSAVALADFIRNAVFDPEEVLDAMRWEVQINVHNSEVTTLLAWRGGTVTGQSVRVMLSELKQRQRVLAEYYRELLQNLREEGIEPPAPPTS
jgi:hypothetical protein